MFEKGERRIRATTNRIVFVFPLFKCCVPYLHHTQGRHEHGQWNKYRISTNQITPNLTRRSNHVDKFKKFSSKCGSSTLEEENQWKQERSLREASQCLQVLKTRPNGKQLEEMKEIVVGSPTTLPSNDD